MSGKKSEKISQFKQFFILIILGLLLIFLAKTSTFQNVLGAFQVVSVPIQTSFHQTTRNISGFFETVVQIGGLRKKNSELDLENEALKAENLKLKGLKKENDSLKVQLGTPNKNLPIIASAHPIGNGAVGAKNVMLIDQGTNDKVKNGDLVIVGNILIGQIFDASNRISSVQLISDPDTKIPAITSAGAEGIIQGKFGAGIKLTDVVQEKILNKDELVTTSGRNSWPKGLVLGKIAKVNKVEKDFFQNADVVPTIDLNNITLVYIVSY